MSHPLVKQLAIELAGIFYDRNRSDRFRKAFPTPEHYFNGRQVMMPGRVDEHLQQITPGWQHHVKTSRKMLTAMLKMQNVDQFKKDAIYEALMEEAKLSRMGGKRVKKLSQARH